VAAVKLAAERLASVTAHGKSVKRRSAASKCSHVTAAVSDGDGDDDGDDDDGEAMASSTPVAATSRRSKRPAALARVGSSPCARAKRNTTAATPTPALEAAMPPPPARSKRSVEVAASRTSQSLRSTRSRP